MQRGVRALPWLLPGVALVVLPKCPACLAAWLAVVTGAGVTATTASNLRIALAVICVASAVFAFVQYRRSSARVRTSRRDA